MRLLKKIHLTVILAVFMSSGTINSCAAEDNWIVTEEADRILYYTHGTAVWGHEFGFFKAPANSEKDMVWLSFSAIDGKIADFEGKGVTVSLEVDGVPYEAKLDMLATGKIGRTHIMYLSNWIAGTNLMNALMKGHTVKASIREPSALVELMDIPGDEFSLEGFAEAREKAKSMCDGLVPDNLPRAGV